jgi:hypothetical protein
MEAGDYILARFVGRRISGASECAMLAAVIYEPGFLIDGFMAEVAARLEAEHIRVRGVMQQNSANENCPAMALVDVASRVRFEISQNLGAEAQGCRLDSHGLTAVSALLDETLMTDFDLLLLNKFGKAEAEGHGLRSALASAMVAGIPVLTAVRPPYTAAWSSFHGGLAIDLAPRLDAVLAWCRNVAAASDNARQTLVACK